MMNQVHKSILNRTFYYPYYNSISKRPFKLSNNSWGIRLTYRKKQKSLHINNLDRDVQELLYDRGINVSHTTVYCWVQKYGKLLYNIWKRKNKQSYYSWKMDETYIKIKGKWHCLYRAVDAEGLTLDIWVRKKHDTQITYVFLKRRSKFYRSLRTASTTIKGMETIRGLYKKSQKEGSLFGFSVCIEIKVLLGIS